MQNGIYRASTKRLSRKWRHTRYSRSRFVETFHEDLAFETLKKKALQENPRTLLSVLTETFHSYKSNPTPLAYSFIIKTLTKQGLLSEIPSLLEKLEKEEKFETPEKLFVDLIRIYGEANMPQEAIGIFFRIPNFRCKPSVYSLNCLLSVLCRNKDYKSVHDVLLRVSDFKIRFETSTFRILSRVLCRIGKMGSAIELMHLMEEHGCVPDSKFISMILSGICKLEQGSSDRVLEFLDEIRKAGFSPSKSDYTSVINLLVKEGRANDALDFLEQMKLEGIKPDIVVYNVVMDGFFAVSNFKQAEAIFDELLVMGLVPDVFTYSIYINGLCKQDKFDGAVELLSTMEEMGCKPNLVTYNTLVMAFCKKGELGKARDLVIGMHLKGVPGNAATYRIMIDGFLENEQMDEARKIMVEMLSRGFVPRSSTFDAMICDLCKCKLVDEALEILEEMVSRSFPPETRTWEALLASFLRTGYLGSSTNLEELMIQPSLPS